MLLHLSDGVNRLELRIEHSADEVRALSTVSPSWTAEATTAVPPRRARHLLWATIMLLLGGVTGFAIGAVGTAPSPPVGPAQAAASAPGDLPPSLLQQLAQPAIVTPPPAMPPAGKNPFGLE